MWFILREFPTDCNVGCRRSFYFGLLPVWTRLLRPRAGKLSKPGNLCRFEKTHIPEFGRFGICLSTGDGLDGNSTEKGGRKSQS
jgi:hypothetical protein